MLKPNCIIYAVLYSTTPGTHGMCVHTAVADVLWDQPHRLPPTRTLAQVWRSAMSTIEDPTTFSISICISSSTVYFQVRGTGILAAVL